MFLKSGCNCQWARMSSTIGMGVVGGVPPIPLPSPLGSAPSAHGITLAGSHVLPMSPDSHAATLGRSPAAPGRCPVATWSLFRPAIIFAMVASTVRCCRSGPKMAFRQLWRGSETEVPGVDPGLTWVSGRLAVDARFDSFPCSLVASIMLGVASTALSRRFEPGFTSVGPLVAGSLVGWPTMLELANFSAPWWLPPRWEWLPCHWFRDRGSRCWPPRRVFPVGWLTMRDLTRCHDRWWIPSRWECLLPSRGFLMGVGHPDVGFQSAG